MKHCREISCIIHHWSDISSHQSIKQSNEIDFPDVKYDNGSWLELSSSVLRWDNFDQDEEKDFHLVLIEHNNYWFQISA